MRRSMPFVRRLRCRRLSRMVLAAWRSLPAAWPMRAGFDWPRPDRRREFLRVRIGGDGWLELFANQSSGVLTSTVWADGVVDNPPGQAIAAGDRVSFIPYSELLS